MCIRDRRTAPLPVRRRRRGTRSARAALRQPREPAAAHLCGRCVPQTDRAGDPRMSGETSPVVAPPSPGLGLPAEGPHERPGPAEPRPPRGLRAVGPRFLQVWYRDAYVFAKLWKTNLFPPLIEPFLYLLALGIGVGYYVRSIDGVGY